MLKRQLHRLNPSSHAQPPSGGCVLKPDYMKFGAVREMPAAFGRLCVETHSVTVNGLPDGPAAFGRLCVETMPEMPTIDAALSSRLRAAVC